MANRVATKCIKSSIGVDTKVLTFIQGLRPRKDCLVCTIYSSLPNYLDEKTGKLKYESDIFLFLDKNRSTEEE